MYNMNSIIDKKNAKNRCLLGFNVTFEPIMTLNVTRSALVNKGFVTL